VAAKGRSVCWVLLCQPDLGPDLLGCEAKGLGVDLLKGHVLGEYKEIFYPKIQT
jgi:hypothetical protein